MKLLTGFKRSKWWGDKVKFGLTSLSFIYASTTDKILYSPSLSLNFEDNIYEVEDGPV